MSGKVSDSTWIHKHRTPGWPDQSYSAGVNVCLEAESDPTNGEKCIVVFPTAMYSGGKKMARRDAFDFID